MTSRDFCYWLQGVFEIHSAGPRLPEPHDSMALHGCQVEMIAKHLAMVFKHEIDPSHGNEAMQKALNEIHKGPIPGNTIGGKINPNSTTMRC